MSKPYASPKLKPITCRVKKDGVCAETPAFIVTFPDSQHVFACEPCALHLSDTARSVGSSVGLARFDFSVCGEP